MDFINKALGAITKTGNEVGQKAKGTAEIAKLKNKIMTKENAVKAIYAEIGKYVYENLREDAPEDIAEKMAKIDAELAEVVACKDAINKLKGVRKCEGCGKVVATTSAFCPFCGTKMPEPVVDEEVVADVTEAVCNECETMEDFGETCAEAVEDVKEEVAEAMEEVCEACEEKVEAFTE